ncbi:MAG: NAD(P)-binding domain-containing protein [Clostridia bacterium]|nr:NAD(P)-binding domain-containing protein [Clostridia bacterium]
MSTKKKAAFFSSKEAIHNAYNGETVQKLSETLDFLPGYYTVDDFSSGKAHDELKDVEYIFSTWGMPALEEKVIEELLPKLKAIFYAAGTVQAFARPFMRRGVKIFSAWGANAVPVAEVTTAEIILANKGFYQNVHRGGEDEWTEHDAGKPYPGNYNTDIGIIGAGMIGTLVIRYLKNYRLNVRVFDPFMTDERAAQLGVEKVSTLPELFSKCHVISNHLANNAQTVGMIDRSCFEKMDETAVFINTGRGQQVVEKDMIDALKAVGTRSAVLDVTYPEPPEKGSELYKMKNVFLTPHTAGSLGNEVQRMGEYMLEEYTALITGKETRYLVSEKMLSTMA